jgi:hypothetical protein
MLFRLQRNFHLETMNETNGMSGIEGKAAKDSNDGAWAATEFQTRKDLRNRFRFLDSWLPD